MHIFCSRCLLRFYLWAFIFYIQTIFLYSFSQYSTQRIHDKSYRYQHSRKPTFGKCKQHADSRVIRFCRSAQDQTKSKADMQPGLVCKSFTEHSRVQRRCLPLTGWCQHIITSPAELLIPRKQISWLNATLWNACCTR